MLRRYFGMLVAAALALPAAATPASAQATYAPVRGTVHLQDLGDRPLRDGLWAGTIGQSRRLEGFSLVSRLPRGVFLQYNCHIQNIGDQPPGGGWLNEGAFCGTRGQGLRLEALRIRVAGPNAARYEVLYQCHIQDRGTSSWMRNGEQCGTTGLSLRLEAFRVIVLRNAFSS
jgi:uncharacterized protein YjdB